MNPKPGASTAPFRARWHSLRNLELGKAVPDASLVYAEHGEIFRLHRPSIRFVRNRQCTSFYIVQPSRVDSRSVRVRAGVVSLLYIATIATFPIGSSGLAACDLGLGSLACRELQKVFGVWWVIKVAMKPPLVECVVKERRYRPIVVWKRVKGHIESIHARMEDSCERLVRMLTSNDRTYVHACETHSGSQLTKRGSTKASNMAKISQLQWYRGAPGPDERNRK